MNMELWHRLVDSGPLFQLSLQVKDLKGIKTLGEKSQIFEVELELLDLGKKANKNIIQKRVTETPDTYELDNKDTHKLCINMDYNLCVY